MTGEIKRKIFSTFFAMLMVSMIFQNVAAEIPTYTLDDNGSNITIATGQQFNVSVQMANLEEWQLVGFEYLGESSYDSSVLEIVDGNMWLLSENPGTHLILNLTFEGISAGSDVITYNHHRYWEYPDQPIDGNFTLNVTVVGSKPINILPILIVVTIIGVVPAIIMFKWMKKENNN